MTVHLDNSGIHRIRWAATNPYGLSTSDGLFDAVGNFASGSHPSSSPNLRRIDSEAAIVPPLRSSC